MNKNTHNDLKELYTENDENHFSKELRIREENFKKLIEEVKKYNEKQQNELKKTNPYAIALADIQKQSEELTASLGEYKDAKEKILTIDKWYNEEYQKLQNKKDKMSSEDFINSNSKLENLRKNKLVAAQDEVWQERGEKIGDIFGDELYKVLTKYGDFEVGMKNITKRLYAYIIQESVNAMLQQIMGLKVMEAVKNALSLGGSSTGFLGAASNLVKGVMTGIGFTKHHSGGIVPVGANSEIPGTTEQLALLKGGERVLSPSENTSYNSSGQSNSSPVIFNNFNVKAWDSKDVQKYLTENKDLLNSITYEGIKNNSSQLRQIVRNA